MEVAEQLGDARDQFHGCGIDSPRQHGTISRPHAKANDQGILRWTIEKSQLQGGHRLGDRLQNRHADAIDVKLAVYTAPGSHDRCRVVTSNLGSGKMVYVASGPDDQPARS